MHAGTCVLSCPWTLPEHIGAGFSRPGQPRGPTTMPNGRCARNTPRYVFQYPSMPRPHLLTEGLRQLRGAATCPTALPQEAAPTPETVQTQCLNDCPVPSIGAAFVWPRGRPPMSVCPRSPAVSVSTPLLLLLCLLTDLVLISLLHRYIPSSCHLPSCIVNGHTIAIVLWANVDSVRTQFTWVPHIQQGRR